MKLVTVQIDWKKTTSIYLFNNWKLASIFNTRL